MPTFMSVIIQAKLEKRRRITLNGDEYGFCSKNGLFV